MNAVRAFKRQAKSDLNLVNTVMMYKAKSSYVNAVNKVYFESEKSRQQALNTMGKYSAGNVMGYFSLQESTRRCIRELAEKGTPAFVDKRGREWSPEAYVMMDMRSTLGNTARAAQNMRCDEYGINLVEISSHLGARPLCAPYQGRIFSRDGSRGMTTDGNGNKIPYSPLSETSYGEAGGLFGVNCGHVQYPFFPGCSFQSYFPYPEEENAERYKQFQKQRYMERKIRATKRECMMFNETGDTEAFKEASVRLKQQRKAYKDYSQSVGLKVHNDRTQVYGFDRSVSSKATWAERKSSGKPLTGSGNGGIINTNLKMSATSQSLPDFGNYQIKKNLEAVKTMETAFKNYGITGKVDFSGIENAEVLEPFLNRLEKIKADTGFVLPNIRAVDIVANDKKCIAAYNPYAKEFYVSNKFFSSREYLEDTLKDWTNNGIMPKQAKTIAYLAEHETAHMRIPDALLETEEADKIHKQFKKSKNANDYDISYKAEFYADSIAVYRIAPNSTPKEMLKAVEYLKDQGVNI